MLLTKFLKAIGLYDAIVLRVRQLIEAVDYFGDKFFKMISRAITFVVAKWHEVSCLYLAAKIYSALALK